MANKGRFLYKNEKKMTYDRFVFHSCKQQKGESVESVYGRLTDQAKNCSLGSEETALIRDAFILNIIDHETQKELLKEPSKALEIETRWRWGHKICKRSIRI